MVPARPRKGGLDATGYRSHDPRTVLTGDRLEISMKIRVGLSTVIGLAFLSTVAASAETFVLSSADTRPAGFPPITAALYAK